MEINNKFEILEDFDVEDSIDNNTGLFISPSGIYE
jgi:hypothetical protein